MCLNPPIAAHCTICEADVVIDPALMLIAENPSGPEDDRSWPVWFACPVCDQVQHRRVQGLIALSLLARDAKVVNGLHEALERLGTQWMAAAS